MEGTDRPFTDPISGTARIPDQDRRSDSRPPAKLVGFVPANAHLPELPAPHLFCFVFDVLLYADLSDFDFSFCLIPETRLRSRRC